MPIIKNRPMDDIETLNRRARLRELIRECFDNKQSNLIRHIIERTGKKPNQGELSAISKDNSGKSFADIKARGLANSIGLNRRWFDMPLGTNLDRDHWMDDLLPSSDMTKGKKGAEFDTNVTTSALGMRAIPVISYVQAGLLTEANDPYAPGQGFSTEFCEDDLGRFAFALEIQGESMLPDFRPGDRIIVDPDVLPNPGDFVVAKNGRQDATFKKYRPRGTGADGQQVFELVPLNDDYPTLRSDVDNVRIIGTMVEHRKKFRR